MRRAGIRRLVRQYTPEVAKLFGVDPRSINVGVGNLSAAGRAGEASLGALTMDRGFLRTADKRDIRGAVIHEITHALGVDSKKGTRGETFADYARYRLNPQETAGWHPSEEVLRMAEKRGDRMPTNPGGQGPKTGRDVNRRRNTRQNALSKMALLSPSQTAAYAAQGAAAQDAYGQAIAAIRAQGGTIRGAYTSTLGDIRAQRIAGTAEAEGAALGRGIVGSSADLGSRAGVVAEAGAARTEARATRNADLSQLRLAEMQAGTTLQSSLAQLQLEKASALAEAKIAAFQNDEFDATQNLYRKLLAGIMAKGKNPVGADPRAPLAQPLQPYPDPYSGKVESRGLYYPTAPRATTYQMGQR